MFESRKNQGSTNKNIYFIDRKFNGTHEAKNFVLEVLDSVHEYDGKLHRKAEIVVNRGF